MSGPVDFTPYLATGAQAPGQTAVPGFQGDFSTLYVSDEGAQTQSGGRINEAIDRVTASTVIVNDGTYNEDVFVDIDDLTLVSVSGSGSTTINGQTDTFGAVRTAPGVEDFDLGDPNDNVSGFTINAGAGAGVYLGAGGDDFRIRGNVINAANGRSALLTEGGQTDQHHPQQHLRQHDHRRRGLATGLRQRGRQRRNRVK